MQKGVGEAKRSNKVDADVLLYLLYALLHNALFFLFFFFFCACAALFMCFILTVHLPSWTPVPADSDLLEDDLSKQNMSCPMTFIASVRRQ